MNKFKVGDKITLKKDGDKFCASVRHGDVCKIIHIFEAQGILKCYYENLTTASISRWTGHLSQFQHVPINYATTLPKDSQARKDYPLYRGLLKYFPAACAGVARISKIGNDKHNPGEDLHHARGKSMDHADCIVRHTIDMEEDFGHGKGRDEQGNPQVDYIAWRALAQCQEWHEEHDGSPLAPGARE